MIDQPGLADLIKLKGDVRSDGEYVLRFAPHVRT
jgi:hypothetical protein